LNYTRVVDHEVPVRIAHPWLVPTSYRRLRTAGIARIFKSGAACNRACHATGEFLILHSVRGRPR